MLALVICCEITIFPLVLTVFVRKSLFRKLRGIPFHNRKVEHKLLELRVLPQQNLCFLSVNHRKPSDSKVG